MPFQIKSHNFHMGTPLIIRNQDSGITLYRVPNLKDYGRFSLQFCIRIFLRPRMRKLCLFSGPKVLADHLVMEHDDKVIAGLCSDTESMHVRLSSPKEGIKFQLCHKHLFKAVYCTERKFF